MKTFNRMLLAVMAVLIVPPVIGCKGAQKGDIDADLKRLEETNCVVNGDTVTCDVRQCAEDCKVYVEQGGELQAVVAFCPGQDEDQKVGFVNNFDGPVDILCRKGSGDQPVTLAQGLESVSSHEDVIADPAPQAPERPASVNRLAFKKKDQDSLEWLAGHMTLVDHKAPTVVSTSPALNDGDIPTSSEIKITFSEAIKEATLVYNNFRVAWADPQNLFPIPQLIPGELNYDALAKVATFTPDEDLPAGMEIYVKLTSGIEDIAGNGLVGNGVGGYQFHFSTTAP